VQFAKKKADVIESKRRKTKAEAKSASEAKESNAEEAEDGDEEDYEKSNLKAPPRYVALVD
jgi:hypothetical protein